MKLYLGKLGVLILTAVITAAFLQAAPVKTLAYDMGKARSFNPIRLGKFHSAVITANGDLYTWGQNYYGELGLGDTVRRYLPAKVEGLSNVSAVSLGYHTSAAITANGDLYLWGSNFRRQLGYSRYDNKHTPTKVNNISNVVAVSVSEYNYAAITANGDLYTWGRRFSGVGDRNSAKNENRPAKVAGLTDVVAVSIGNFLGGYPYNAAVTANGDLYTWGDNIYGQLGHGDTQDKYSPTKVAGLTNVVAVSLGGSHSAAITANGDLYTWGYNEYGELGHGDNDNRHIPTKVESLANVAAVSLGGSHSAAITANGDLYYWGFDHSIENAQFPTKYNHHTLPVKAESSDRFAALSLGQIHGAAMTAKGEFYTWGSDGYLGTLDIGGKSVPTKITTLTWEGN
jgi:alpha-tubulin suppressor-like RCC1 family protein